MPLRPRRCAPTLALALALLLAGGPLGARPAAASAEPAVEPPPPPPADPAAGARPDPATSPAAAPAPPPADAPAPRRDAAASARAGLFLPLTQAADIGRQRLTALVLGGGDSLATPRLPDGSGGLRPVPLLYARVEGALFDRVSLFVGVEYNGMEAQAIDAWNPSVGVRVRLLSQARHGVDLGVGLLYRNHGFSQADGELELSVLVARRFERVGLYGNLVYGQGLVPDDRDAELRLAALAFLGDRFTLGADLRARVDLSNGGPDPGDPASGAFDLVAGPVATAALGPVVLLAQVGAHALLQGGALGAGVVGQGGVGLSF